MLEVDNSDVPSEVNLTIINHFYKLWPLLEAIGWEYEISKQSFVFYRPGHLGHDGIEGVDQFSTTKGLVDYVKSVVLARISNEKDMDINDDNDPTVATYTSWSDLWEKLLILGWEEN